MTGIFNRRAPRPLSRLGRWFAGAVAVAATWLDASSAAANPRALPFTYPHQTLAQGEFEAEQYFDTTPVRVIREDEDGSRAVTSFRSQLQTELEYGLTDRLEVGWYFVFRQAASPGTPIVGFTGVKQRLRYRFADAGEWPVNVGVYFEVAEYHNEIEVEEKLLLSRRFGRLNLMTNLWIEQEYYFQTEVWKFLYNPTAGLTFDIAPNVIIGAEYWARGSFVQSSAALGNLPNATPRHYLGPTMLAAGGPYWFSIGAYTRLDSLDEPLEPYESWGRFYVRAIIGIDF